MTELVMTHAYSVVVMTHVYSVVVNVYSVVVNVYSVVVMTHAYSVVVNFRATLLEILVCLVEMLNLVNAICFFFNLKINQVFYAFAQYSYLHSLFRSIW